MPVVNFYNTRPDELQSGDVLVCVVTLHVGYRLDSKGRPTYRMYRCDWPDTQEGDGGIPQGSNIDQDTKKVAEALFPVVGWANLIPER